MPISNPEKAITHLYPDITEEQFKFRDRRGETGIDEEGNPYIITNIELEYLDPSLGDPPTQAELEQAELDYVAPSYLNKGTREPGLSEIERDLRAAYDYFRWRVGEKVRKVAKNDGYSEIFRDEKGNFVERGVMEKAAKYAQLLTGPFRRRATELLNWESDVWAYLQTRWQQIDPRGDFTGFDGATPPTWPQLENDIDTNHPEP